MTEDRGTPHANAELDVVLDRARRLGEEGDWESAAADLRDALPEWPEDATLLCWLGVAERELGLEGVAYERFRTAVGLEPEDPVLLSVAGTALAAFDDPDAEGALRTAALLAPRVSEVRWRYGAFLSREGFLEQALEELDASIELDPDSSIAFYERGVARALDGRVDTAIDDFARSVELDDDPWTRSVLGLAMVVAGRVEESVLELELGAAHGVDPRAHLLAALAHAAFEDDGAWRHLEMARGGAEGTEELLVEEVDSLLSEGPDAARRFLVGTLGPTTLRERLMERP
jgi:tetratricopeptide (TPR) repeat protein